LNEYDASLVAYVADGHERGPSDTPTTEAGRYFLSLFDPRENTAGRWAVLENAVSSNGLPPAQATEMMNLLARHKGTRRLAERPPEEPKSRWTAKELYDMKFVPQVFLIEDLLPQRGLVLLVGREKSGKTWLALQVSQAVCTGGQVFGRETTKGKVVYFSCDDPDEAAFRGRIFSFQQWDPTDDFVLYTSIIPTSTADPDGLEHLETVIRKEKPTLLVLDTFRACFLHADENDQRDVTRISNGLKRLALRYDCVILVIHHQNKSPGSENWLDKVSGSTGLAAGATMIWGLMEEGERVRFQTKGHRAAALDLTIKFVTPEFYWDLVGETEDVTRKQGHKIVIDTLRKFGVKNDETGYPELWFGDLVSHSGKDKGNISRWVDELSEGLTPKVRLVDVPGDRRKRVALLEKANNSNNNP
jgi:hypothetical protein